MKYEIPEKIFKTIATLEDLDQLDTIKKKYRNARYGKDVVLAVDDRKLYLIQKASN